MSLSAAVKKIKKKKKKKKNEMNIQTPVLHFSSWMDMSHNQS